MKIIDSLIEICRRYAATVMAMFMASLSLRVFSGTVLDVIKGRDHYAEAIRKRALPQRKERRVWRRKVSRL